MSEKLKSREEEIKERREQRVNYEYGWEKTDEYEKRWVEPALRKPIAKGASIVAIDIYGGEVHLGYVEPYYESPSPISREAAETLIDHGVDDFIDESIKGLLDGYNAKTLEELKERHKRKRED